MIDVGFDTIGNATIICHDRGPVLATDPWISGSAYFGSWTLSHMIPDEYMEAILACRYIWFSHGHPDHLNSESLPLFKEKKILLPDHVGNRIYNWLHELGYNTYILKDKQWYNVSDRIKIMCIADYNQDAVLLIDINGHLIVNTNDASAVNGWGSTVKRIIRNYSHSFLLSLSGFGDADMINFYDEKGVFSPPFAAKRLSVGKQIAQSAEYFGVKFFIPFSSMHRYQRRDSIWANQYVTSLADYPVGFDSKTSEILPAFIRYNCADNMFNEIRPPKTPEVVLEPKDFGDDWDEELEDSDISTIKNYFFLVEHLSEYLDFINVRVGGRDNIIEFKKKKFNRGITFESPKYSLMVAIQCEIFDDLLIGNFMKTTLHGSWPSSKLYPDFSPYVAKYSDNGRAKSLSEVSSYFREYRSRDPISFLYHTLDKRAKDFFRKSIHYDSKTYILGKNAYWMARKLFP
jgi:hypothetical protein